MWNIFLVNKKPKKRGGTPTWNIITILWWVVIQIFVNWTWTWIHLSPIAWTVKSVNDNFLHFSWFWEKNCKIQRIQHDFTRNQSNYVIRAWTGIHDLELKWNMSLWNATNCFWAWISREFEWTDPSLHSTPICITLYNHVLLK